MRPGNVSYRQAQKTGCLRAGSTLKLFSKKFCFAILMKLRTTATIQLLVCFWILSATYELLIFTLVTTATQRKHTPLQLVTTETKGGKGTSFGNF